MTKITYSISMICIPSGSLDIKSKIEVIKGTFEWRCIDDKDYVSLLHEDTSQPPFHFSPLPTTAHLCKSFNLFRFIMYLCYFKIQAFWFFLFFFSFPPYLPIHYHPEGASHPSLPTFLRNIKMGWSKDHCPRHVALLADSLLHFFLLLPLSFLQNPHTCIT
jgi:hypothetical protein